MTAWDTTDDDVDGFVAGVRTATRQPALRTSDQLTGDDLTSGTDTDHAGLRRDRRAIVHGQGGSMTAVDVFGSRRNRRRRG